MRSMKIIVVKFLKSQPIENYNKNRRKNSDRFAYVYGHSPLFINERK